VRLVFVLLVALVASAAFADVPTTPASDFGAANERLLSGDAGGAIALYQHLDEQGVVARDLAYNHGVALARAGRSVDAIVAFERALRLDPGFGDARSNLSVMRARFPTRGAPRDEAPTAVADVLEPLTAPLPPDAVAFVSVATTAILCLLLALRRLGLARARAFAALSGVALVLAFGSSLIVAAQGFVRADPRAVVTATRAIKDGPEPRFTDVATLTAGERVRVQKIEGAWVEVRATDGVTGWMQLADVTRI